MQQQQQKQIISFRVNRMVAHFSTATDIGVISWKGFALFFLFIFCSKTEVQYKKHDVGNGSIGSFQIDVMISLYPK